MSKDQPKPLNLSEILKSTNEPVAEIHVEGIDQPLKLYKLTNADVLTLDEARNDLERSFKLLWIILKKNDSSISYEQVLNMPSELSNKLISEIMKYSERFLSRPKRSVEPSVTQESKESLSSVRDSDTNQVR